MNKHQPTDYRKQTKDKPCYVSFTEKGKPHKFTGGKKGRKVIIGKEYHEVFLSGEIEAVNGDRFHAIIEVSALDSGEHFGTLLMLPKEIPCCLCDKMEKLWPDAGRDKGYYFKKGAQLKYYNQDYIERMALKPMTCPVCGGTGTEHYAASVDPVQESAEFKALTGIDHTDLFPYRYCYYAAMDTQGSIGFMDYHVDQDTGWSEDDESYMKTKERRRNADAVKKAGEDKHDCEVTG